MKNRKKILLVEDNPDDEALVLRSLRKCGVDDEVVIAHDGQAALDYMFATGPYAGRDRGDMPSVVFLDLSLPKLDGFQVLERLRAEKLTRLQPVVILSSSDEPKDRRRGYAIGANSYVCKPIDSGEFYEAVDRLGRYWTRLNKPPQD